MTTATSNLLYSLAATLAIVAIGAACAATAHAQRVDYSLPPLADLTIASQYHSSSETGWVVTVTNNPVGAHPGIEVTLIKVRITISDPVRGDDTQIWTIRDLPPGGTATRGVSWLEPPRPATSASERVPQRIYAEIIESVPAEPETPRFQFNNATEHWGILTRNNINPQFWSGLLTNGNAGVEITRISNRLPRAEGATTFTVHVENFYESLRYGDRTLRPGQDHTQFDVQVEISLSAGLSFAGTQQVPPSGTTFDSTTGIWDVGAMTFGADRSLPVAVNLTSDLADLPLEDRCLTAKVVRAVPWFASDPSKRQNDTATACLGVELLSSGMMDLIDFYPCIGVTSYPCTDANTLELVIKRSGGDISQPEEVIVHVPDHGGRNSRGGELVWSTEDLMDLRDSQTRLTADWEAKESVKVTAPGGGDAPGRWLLTNTDDSNNFDLLDARDSTKVDYEFYSLRDEIGTDQTEYFLDVKVEFWEMGTYEALFGISGRLSGTTYRDSGTYIFHVGPASDLEVRDAGANPEVAAGQSAYTILAVNNGPDPAPAVRVNLTGVPEGAEAHPIQGSYAEGTCQSGLCEGVWTIGELYTGYNHRPSVYAAEGAALTLIVASGDPITAGIENTQDYCVRIKTSAKDPENDLECAEGSVPTGYTEHTAAYYDHRTNNNRATIAARAGTGERAGAARDLRVMETRVGNILTWQPVATVNDYAVTHYEVERWASSWTPLAVVKDSMYVDMAGRSNADYRVRAVNVFGVGGLWSITGRPPDAPGNFRVDLSESGNAAVLTWTEPASPSPITGYVIDISDSTDGDSRTNDRTVGGNVTTWTHNLGAGDVKFYRVQARNRDGGGQWTAWQSVGAGPGAPGNLRARPNGSSETVLTWSAASSRDVPIYEYELEYSDTSASEGYEWTFLQTVLPHEGLRYVDDTVVPGTTRSYRVRAWTVGDQSAAGAWSNVASATTPPAGPSMPLNVLADYAVGNTENGILLTWDASASGDASYYRIEHSTDGATWESERARHTGTCDVGGATKFCYTDSGLFSGTEHWYRVAGVNSSGVAGGWATSNSHITQGEPTEAPGEPQNLRVASVSGRQVSLAWDAPLDTGGSPVTGYEYQVHTACAHDPSEVCQLVRPTSSGRRTTATVTVPNVKGQYEFSVRALNAVGAGHWTQPASQYINPQRTWRVTLSPSGLTVPEGNQATYRVRLTSDPGQPVMLVLWWDGDPDLGNTLSHQQFKWLLPSNYASRNPDLYLDPEFTSPWNTGVTITVTADEDDDSDNGTALIDNTVFYVPCADLGNPAGCEDDPEDTGVTVWLTATERDND